MTTMAILVIDSAELEMDVQCALCSRAFHALSGVRLANANDLRPVCRECGHRHAGDLAALVDLAMLADRVGRVHHYNSARVPLVMLLDLARASERLFAASDSPPMGHRDRRADSRRRERKD